MMYKVLSNLKHDGIDFKAGDTIELENSIANQLVDDGVLESATTVEDKKEQTNKTTEKKNEVKDEDEDKGEVEDLQAMTKAELMELAESEKLEEVSMSMTKDEMIEAIGSGREEKNEVKDEDENL